MTEIEGPTLAIGIAPSADGRRKLAQLLGSTEAFLIVSSADQVRQFLDVVSPPGAAMTEVASPGLRIDSDRRVLCWLEREVALTPLEHDLLCCLVAAPGRVWAYEKLHLAVWGNRHLGRGSDIHSTVRRVRAKLEGLGSGATIHAVRGVGILFSPA